MNVNSNNNSLRQRTCAVKARGSLAVCISLMTLVVVGCSLFQRDKEGPREILKTIETPKTTEPQTEDNPTQANEDVRFDGGLLLGDTDNLAFRPNELASVLKDLLDSEKQASLQVMVATYPDITMKILRDEKHLTVAYLNRLARVYDQANQRLAGSPNIDTEKDPQSWQAFTQFRLMHDGNDSKSSLRKTKKTFSELCEQFQEELTQNRPAEALKLKLHKKLDGQVPLLAQCEILRLEGIAYLMREEFDQSVSRFERSRELAAKHHPYVASQVGLLLGEAYRHAGHKEKWKEAWTTAVEIQSRWVEESQIQDPAFWKKAAFLKPLDTQWPSVVVQRIQNRLRQHQLIFSGTASQISEAAVWALIGLQSLKRHESQNAILALKKSESLAQGSKLKEELRLQQAVAMIDGGQPGPASAILIRMSSLKTMIGDRAKAVLATLKLQNGSLVQGMNLLQDSIKTSRNWPTEERLKAEADFGLALLMRGREREGVQLLNQVCSEFIGLHNHEHATQCLWNLALYFDKTENAGKAEATLARLKKLESNP